MQDHKGSWINAEHPESEPKSFWHGWFSWVVGLIAIVSIASILILI